MYYLTLKQNAYAAQTEVKALQGGYAMHDGNRSTKTEDRVSTTMEDHLLTSKNI